MKKNKISLDKFIELTEKAVMDANKRILADFVSEVKKNPAGVHIQSAPVIVSKMKVTFSAGVDAAELNNDSISSLKLDFGRMGGFCGEFEIHTSDSPALKKVNLHREGRNLNERS